MHDPGAPVFLCSVRPGVVERQRVVNSHSTRHQRTSHGSLLIDVIGGQYGAARARDYVVMGNHSLVVRPWYEPHTPVFDSRFL
jgi:hypothetical protein